MTSTEIAVHENGHAIAERDTVDGWVAVASDVIKVANLIAETEFVPAEYRDSPPAVAAAILTGRELGIGPMMSLRHVQIVRGVPTLSAEYKRARVLAAGHDFEVVELNTQRCHVRGRRTGNSKWLDITFTMDDAKTAGLLAPSKSGKPGAWHTRPRRMLFARAGSELCDFIFADVTNGLPTAEIVADGAEDDEFAGYNESPAQAAPASDGEKPAPRTARRARTAPAARPTAAAPAAASAPTDAPATAQTVPSGDGPPLPPLPGEDEVLTSGARDTSATDPANGASSSEPSGDDRDYDSPGTVTTPQLSAIWTVLRQVFKFTGEEKDQARAVAAHIIGRPLASTRQMSHHDAKAILDTLANWQATAAERGEQPRDLLIAYMAAEAEATDG